MALSIDESEKLITDNYLAVFVKDLFYVCLGLLRADRMLFFLLQRRKLISIWQITQMPCTIFI